MHFSFQFCYDCQMDIIIKKKTEVLFVYMYVDTDKFIYCMIVI